MNKELSAHNWLSLSPLSIRRVTKAQRPSKHASGFPTCATITSSEFIMRFVVFFLYINAAPTCGERGIRFFGLLLQANFFTVSNGVIILVTNGD